MTSATGCQGAPAGLEVTLPMEVAAREAKIRVEGPSWFG